MTLAEVLPAPGDEASANAVGRGLAGGIVVGLLIAGLEFAALRDSVASSMLAQLTWLLRLSVQWSLGALPVGFAIGILELRSRSHPPSARSYAISIVVGSVAGAIVVTLYDEFVDSISQTSHGFEMDWPNMLLYAVWQFVFWGAVGAILHASNLRQKRSAIALRVGELARLRSERRLAEARLEALHAQVEPEFVLSTLRAVQRLYERDPAAADRALDALIRFLRKATPLLRQQGSTIGQECRLLHAYVQTLGTVTSAGGSVRVDVDERAEGTPLSPGLLLTLAQDLLAAIPAGESEASFDVRASCEDAGTSIDVSIVGVSVDGSAVATSIDHVRHRVITACGPRTTLDVLRHTPLETTLRLTLLDPQRGDEP